jgi:hypothetical protein
MRLPQWPRKQGCWIFLLKIYFQSIFAPKHQENTLETLVNQSVISKNTKTHHKTQNQPKIKTNHFCG